MRVNKSLQSAPQTAACTATERDVKPMKWKQKCENSFYVHVDCRFLLTIETHVKTGYFTVEIDFIRHILIIDLRP
ncbi:hypothetical protein JZ751_015698 [Albula glossodonta]|uniref:Uncharacterized protein n=1 Tax=Albula glossodonta TaxID=121402 RepID=A0A8T2NTG0_9TELE|nr:hypothetical protein JZ751_015698 [Albula glossodonta]